MELRWAAVTDPGRIREENEDTFVVEPQIDGQGPMVFAVADGMGGHQAGEVASAIAAETVRNRLADGAPNVDVVVAAVHEANASIFQRAHTSKAHAGMGTTLVGLTVLPATDERTARFALVNVGDSRCYLLREGELHRASVDHNYVQELIATGLITADEARNHPRRNIITRALGIEPSVRVDAWELPIVRGDRFILCSDGLVDEVDDEDIAHLAADADPAAAADALLAAALAHGGRDNITIVVVDVVDGDDVETAEPLPDPITEQVPTVQTMVAADPTPEAGFVVDRPQRRLDGRTFLLLLAGAVLLTVVIVLVAVALTGTDAPPPVTTTTTPSTTVEAPETTPPATTTAPSTTRTSPPTTTPTATTATPTTET
jgi:PPM family protein phosphatase